MIDIQTPQPLKETEGEKSNVLQVSPSIFYPTYESKKRRIVHQGGQWSGKTVNILAVLAVKAANERNKLITITADTMPHLKGGALSDFEQFIEPHFKSRIARTNKTDHRYYFTSGSVIEFKSFEKPSDASGPKRDYLFINEADKFDYQIYFQLDSRTREQTFIDYNPTARFWAHEHVNQDPETDFFISDHRHNPFLSEALHRQVENIKDPDLWRVYARGLTGNLLGTIYPDWVQIPDNKFPKEDGVVYGIDYGYTNDPTAIVKMVRIGESIFIHEVCYEPGIAPKTINELLRATGYKEETLYSEHDPEMISALRRLELTVTMARKGQGSVKAGILFLRQFKVFYTASSKNLALERQNYMWKQDKDSGKSTNEPEDKFNHLMDAVRYGAYTAWCNN